MNETVLGLPRVTSSVTVGRHEAREALIRWQVPHLVDDVQLVVAELVANAVRHATSHVQLRLLLDGATLRVEVSDDQPVMVARRAAKQELPENGRGLLIVEALSRDWGVDGSPAGKTVWCELDVPPSATLSAEILPFDTAVAQHGVQQRSGSDPVSGSAAS